MSATQKISIYLPFLRRFARVVTGSQVAGDEAVVRLLNTLIGQPEILDGEPDVKIALYRLFLKRAVQPPAEDATSGPAKTFETRLAKVTPEARIAFLLKYLEEFSPQQISLILVRDHAEVSGLIARAGNEITKQMRTRVLIIEDEPLIAFDLQNLVESIGHEVVETARTHREAVDAANRHQPGLILADIQLADGSSGLEAVKEVLAGFEVPVIFITAYPERLLTGERPEPAFLVSKPFEAENVKAIISQALFFAERPDDH